jgi:Ca2+-binding RTX toxin-like protein
MSQDGRRAGWYDLVRTVDVRGRNRWWAPSGRSGRLATLVVAGAVLAGAVGGDAAAEARAGFDAAAGTFALSVDTGAGPDGNHAYEVLRYYLGPGGRGIGAREISGYANDGLTAVSTCTRVVFVGVWVGCAGSVRQASLVFGDGTDVLALGPPDVWGSTAAHLCDIGVKSADELPSLPVEVRLGAGNDRLLRVDGRESACDSPQWGYGYLDHTWAVRAFGQAGNDTLAGGEINDLLDGGDGSDVLVGIDGGDTLQGGAGDDRATGGDGADTLRGGGGGDRLDGGRGADAMLGEDDADTLVGGGDADLLDGGAGADDLDGGSGDDTLRGGGGNDDLVGGLGSDSVDGGDGLLDEVSYETATSRVVVTLADTAANDGGVVNGVGERDSLRAVESVGGGRAGDDLTGSAVLNILRGRGGDDILRGLGARDLLYGGDGNDQLFGGDGNDELRGDAGADQLAGGAGDDRLDGGDGNDGLKGDAGADTFVGGAGRNLMLARDGEADRFDCALGSDEVQADLVDAVPAGCETVDRYALDDGPPGAATGTRLTADGTNRVTVTIACPASARVACRGEVRLADPDAPGSALATSAPYTISVGVSGQVTMQPAAAVVASLAQRGTVAVVTVEQGASTSGQRESRRTLTFARS